MLKVVLLLKRKPGLSLDEFIQRYETEHVPLAEKHAAGLLRYERRYLHPSPQDLYGNAIAEPEYDVVTELWYDSQETFDKQQGFMRRHPERFAGIIADEEKLFDRSKSRVAFVEQRVSDLEARAPRIDIERELRRLIDKDAIVDLVHRYSYLVDHRLPDELAQLFTEDCLVDYGPGIGPPVRGRRAFRAMFGRPIEPSSAQRVLLATSHHNANVLVSFDTDDRASVITSVYAWHRAADGGTPRIWGSYHDVAVRTSEGWRLHERVLRIAGSEQWPIEWHPMAKPKDTRS